MNVTVAEVSCVNRRDGGRNFRAMAKKLIGRERGRALPDMRGEEDARWGIYGVVE